MHHFFMRLLYALFLPILLIFTPAVDAAKLAIVIDDIGYRQTEDRAIYALPKEVSVAIIPVAPYATARAQQAYEQQRDVLIHLPMQPLKAQPIEAGALKIGMSQQQISDLIKTAREQIPYAIGLNNHMGSGATAHKQSMQYLMTALAEQQLFFLDSKTNGASVAYQTAQQAGVKALERHIFLDDSDQFADVARQFQAAIHYARKHGTAVMIGHPRKNSIAVLEAGIRDLPSDIELVSLSSLWREEQVIPEKPFILRFEIEPAPTSQAPYQSTPLLRGIPKD